MEWQVVERKKRKSTPNSEVRALRQSHPHIMDRSALEDIEKTRNIAGLVRKMMSRDWVELQMEGWEFVNVFKPEEEYPREREVLIKELENGWGDFVVFAKIQ